VVQRDHARAPAILSQLPAEMKGVGDRDRRCSFHDHHWVAVPAPDEQVLPHRASSLWVRRAFADEVRHRSDARTRGGAGAPLRAGFAAISPCLATGRARLFAYRQILRARAVTGRRLTT